MNNFNGDNNLDEIMWAMFQSSGKISYYLFGKELKKNEKKKQIEKEKE